MSDHVIRPIQDSFLKEKDIEFANESLPSIIKIAEGMYYFRPKSSYYSGKLAFLYTAYCFAYVDRTPFDDLSDTYEKEFERMNYFYRKGYEYGRLSMEERIKYFSSNIVKNQWKL